MFNSSQLIILSQAFVPTLLRNWAVFIPVQILNFSVVPPQGRFVFVSVVNLFWSESFSSSVPMFLACLYLRTENRC